MTRPFYEMDIENLLGYFCVKFRHLETNTIFNFEMWPGSPPLDVQRIVDILSQVTITTFNGGGYDLPILTLALYGADNATLKKAGDEIIVGQMKSWDFYRHYQIEPPEYIDHIDLMEVAAGVRIGLKMYGGRMHTKQMQDLPVDPTVPLPPCMRQPVNSYCDNDLIQTGEMRLGLKSRLDLRMALSEKYGVDLRSKSDAQIAEAVFKAKLPFRPERRWVKHGYTFKYDVPAHIKFITPELRDLLDTIRKADFFVSDKEEAEILGIENVVRTGVQIPPELKGRDIVIGGNAYRLGIGGLHSKEKGQCVYADADNEIEDDDVDSYYPQMIINSGMFPAQIGEAFQTIYQEVVTRRLWCKDEVKRLKSLAYGLGGDEGLEILAEAKVIETEADGLKIVANGTFGKLFSKYSIFYNPEQGIYVTLTGQLSLLMLIELQTASGIRVISANTDGIVQVIPKHLKAISDSNIAWWQQVTGLKMSATHYSMVASRDVNNYIAVTLRGDVKRKGILRESGLLNNKHPDKDICAVAVVDYITKGVPVEDTIMGCKDIKQFVTVRNVKGGGVYVRHSSVATSPYLGKAVRWYYGTTPGYIAYKSNGNQVASSDGATPLMLLPDTFPTDVDYENYIATANKMLDQMGVE